MYVQRAYRLPVANVDLTQNVTLLPVTSLYSLCLSGKRMDWNDRRARANRKSIRSNRFQSRDLMAPFFFVLEESSVLFSCPCRCVYVYAGLVCPRVRVEKNTARA